MMDAGLFFRAAALFAIVSNAEHHMKRYVEPRQNSGSSVPLIVANWCNEDIYPGILSQGGSGPEANGFLLAPGTNRTLSVGSDWQGRVWPRTNCTFSGGTQIPSGKACSTGDCGGAMECQIAGQSPATLAEFTLQGGQQQTFYDISVVDGYNIPLAIVLLPNGNSQLAAMAGRKTNPSCVASVGDLAAPNFNPYSGGQQFLGTNAQNPLPFDTTQTSSSVSQWCPWDLQVDAPTGPGGGVYPYPDGNVQRPAFDPCFSACAKYNTDKYCCTGSFDGPGKCFPSYYSRAAKSVCPDAYSYAFDDQDSTFIVPQGGGFQVIFCPGGRSTNIIATTRGSSSASASSGSHVTSLQLPWGGKKLLIDGRAPKAALAGLFVVLALSMMT